MADTQYYKGYSQMEGESIQITANYIFKEANIVADWLFKFGDSITNSFSTDLCLSPHFRSILAEDVVGRTFIKKSA